MQFQSIVQERGSVHFPEYTGERFHMVGFTKANGLPEKFSRWQPTVDQMLEDVDTDGPVYIMVDQSFTLANNTQRRSGIHIDGYWVAGELSAHSPNFPRPGHEPRPEPAHRPVQAPGWSSGPTHSASRGGHHDWYHATFDSAEGVILASSLTAARALRGNFEGHVGNGGDCSHIDISGMESVIMESGTVYAGNVTMLHESLPLDHDFYRTIVRLNVPGWSPELARYH